MLDILAFFTILAISIIAIVFAIGIGTIVVLGACTIADDALHTNIIGFIRSKVPAQLKQGVRR